MQGLAGCEKTPRQRMMSCFLIQTTTASRASDWQQKFTSRHEEGSKQCIAYEEGSTAIDRDGSMFVLPQQEMKCSTKVVVKQKIRSQNCRSARKDKATDKKIFFIKEPTNSIVLFSMEPISFTIGSANQQNECDPKVSPNDIVQRNTDLGICGSTKGERQQHPLQIVDREFQASKRCSKRLLQKTTNPLVDNDPPAPPLKLPKIRIILTRNEFSEDWRKITGHKYTGKPKKSSLGQLGLGLCSSLTCPSTIRYLKD